MPHVIPRQSLSEELIERRVECLVDHLDRVFLAGDIDQARYDLAMTELNQWAEEQHAFRRAELARADLAATTRRPRPGSALAEMESTLGRLLGPKR